MPVYVLDVDPELGENLDGDSFRAARDTAVAAEVVLEPGRWVPPPAPADSACHLGLLVTEGLLIRNVALAGSVCSELLGHGELLRPWDDDSAGAPLPLDSGWCVLERTCLAVLDRRFTLAIARWPELGTAITQRVLRRSRWLACLLAISHLTRIDARVLALLWHLADRYGRVTAEGVVVPLDLTHEMVARLVGARRQSVTTALGALADRGLVTRLPDRAWLLSGDPAVELARTPATASNGSTPVALATT